MKKIAIAVLIVFALTLVALAQKKVKPWTEWSEKEVTKMLNDSAWGQTQTETNTSEMFYSPTAQGGGIGSTNTGGITGGNDRNAQGALNQATSVNFRIRLLSSKPVRQAFARKVILQNPQAEAQLKAFAEQVTTDWIVVAVDYESKDQRFSGKVMQSFNSAIASTLKNNTYLETKSGQRVFLADYKAPIKDGMGAKFIFPRTVDGKPVVDAESGFLRFYSEVVKDVKLNMRFKVSDLMYDGKLEY